MKCTFCAAPLPISGLVCSYCGQRNSVNIISTPVKKLDDRDKINCPVCDITLERMDIGLRERVVAHHCDKCDGLFLNHNDLKKSIDAQSKGVTRVNPKLLRFVLDNPRYEKQSTKRFYRKCPLCSVMMVRVNYKSVSGVIIDKCMEHGVWLDGGELQQLFEWSEVGGDLKATNYKANYSSFSFSTYKSNRFLPDPIENFFLWVAGL